MGCCSGDADDKELATVDPEIKAEAEEEMKQEEEYEPSGSGRIPGSKYTISEVDVLECKDEKHLKKCVAKHAESSRGETSCCCGKGGVLAEWEWVKSLDAAREIIKKEGLAIAGQLENEMADDDSGDVLAAYLGPKANKEQNDPPNPNYFDGVDEDATLLHFNRKKLIADIYAADQPMFKAESGGSDKVERIEHIPDAEIDQLDLDTCKKELRKRGFNKPPFNVCVLLDPADPKQQQNLKDLERSDDKPACLENAKSLAELKELYGVAVKISIQKEKANDAGHIAFKFADTKNHPKTSSEQSNDLATIIAAEVGADAMSDFHDGVDKVRKMKLKEAQGILKLIGHDPRFQGGQPVVQPSYFERQCRNCECCVLFWLYWIGMLVVMGIAVTTGDPYRLIRPIDYNGDTCGSVEVPGKEQMYYPQMALDAMKMYSDQEYAATCADSVSGCFYGVCTDGCPKKGTYICNYETQAGIEAGCDTECATSTNELCTEDCILSNQEESNGEGCWVVQMNSIEIFKRCLPWEPTTVETEYSCDVTVTSQTGEVSVVSTPIETDNCPCGGADMLDCTDEQEKKPDTERCVAQIDQICWGESSVAPTCTGTPVDPDNNVAAVWTPTNTWTGPQTSAVWTPTNVWDSGASSCSDGVSTTEGDCTAAGACNDAGNTGPADAAACAQLFSDSGSCSDTSLTTEAACIAPGTCNNADDSTPADSAACAQLFSDSGKYGALLCEQLGDTLHTRSACEALSCTFTPSPKCDLDPDTDPTYDGCPPGCDKTAINDPETDCEISAAGVWDDTDEDVLVTEGTCRTTTDNTGSGYCAWTVDSKQEQCSAGVMDMKLQLGCTNGVIHRTMVEEAEYTEGTETMSDTLTTYSAWLNQAGSDVYNSASLIILMGPVLAAVAAFFFIFFMSYFAGVLIWTTLITLQFVFIATTLFMSWQCGYLQDALEGVINTTSTAASNDTWAGVAGDGATTAQAFLEGYSAFGETDEEATESNEVIWMVAFWACLILTIVYFFALLGLRKQIKLAIELVKEAGRTVRKMPMALFYPLFTYALSFVMFIYFLSVATFIITSSATADSLQETYNFPNASFDMDTLTDVAEAAQAELLANDTIVAYNSTEAETNDLVRGLFVYHLFGYFWVSEFIKAIGMLTIAGAICSDYWITNDALRPNSPVAQSFVRAIRYHAGSAVYGAAVIAIIRLWRAFMMYVDKQTQELQKANKAAMIAMKLIHCCLWCLEKIARYISNAAYIMIAIEGRGFCVSAWRSFKLLFSNSLRIATTESIALLIIWLANIGITMCCVMLTMLALNNLPMYTCIGLEAGEDCTSYVDNALIPSIFVGITSFMIAYCFMQVYGMAITTILLSFCLDEDKFKNGQYKEKLNDEGVPDGRMFCVLRGKIGLIKLVSPNIAKEQEALEASQEKFAVEQAKLALAAKGGARP